MKKSATDKGAGASNVQNRDRQPKRASGDSLEQHGAERAERIAQGASTGTNQTWGATRSGASIEKHSQPKNIGKHFVGGKLVGDAPEIPENIEVASRRKGSGSDSSGGVEVTGQPKATRLNMDPAHRFNS